MKENDYHFFAYISRMRFINRWALMRNSYTENIQEHSHMTAVLAHALAVIRNQFFDGRVDRQVERVAEEKLLAMLPDELRPTYSAALSPAAPEIQQLVKAADKLSAYIKCLEELKAGNTEFKQAAEQTRYALDDMELPELDYFLENFLPSFKLTLDELE